jgi:hypothetical protein
MNSLASNHQFCSRTEPWQFPRAFFFPRKLQAREKVHKEREARRENRIDFHAKKKSEAICAVKGSKQVLILMNRRELILHTSRHNSGHFKLCRLARELS